MNPTARIASALLACFVALPGHADQVVFFPDGYAPSATDVAAIFDRSVQRQKPAHKTRGLRLIEEAPLQVGNATVLRRDGDARPDCPAAHPVTRGVRVADEPAAVPSDKSDCKIAIAAASPAGRDATDGQSAAGQTTQPLPHGSESSPSVKVSTSASTGPSPMPAAMMATVSSQGSKSNGVTYLPPVPGIGPDSATAGPSAKTTTAAAAVQKSDAPKTTASVAAQLKPDAAKAPAVAEALPVHAIPTTATVATSPTGIVRVAETAPMAPIGQDPYASASRRQESMIAGPAVASSLSASVQPSTAGARIRPHLQDVAEVAVTAKTTAVVASPAPSHGAPIERLSLALPIQFSLDSAKLLAASYDQLDAIGTGIKLARTQFKLVIEGHTDSRGSRQYNLMLSEKRAQAVRDYLVKRHGIDPERLKVVGKGMDAPLNVKVPSAPENRRVEFHAEAI